MLCQKTLFVSSILWENAIFNVAWNWRTLGYLEGNWLTCQGILLNRMLVLKPSILWLSEHWNCSGERRILRRQSWQIQEIQEARYLPTHHMGTVLMILLTLRVWMCKTHRQWLITSTGSVPSWPLVEMMIPVQKQIGWGLWLARACITRFFHGFFILIYRYTI